MGKFKKTERSNGQQTKINHGALPHPLSYFHQHLNFTDKGREWLKVPRCIFCGGQYTLSINIEKGCYTCRKTNCKAKGGGIIKFHMQLKSINFVEACKQLGIWQGNDYAKGVPIHD